MWFTTYCKFILLIKGIYLTMYGCWLNLYPAYSFDYCFLAIYLAEAGVLNACKGTYSSKSSLDRVSLPLCIELKY